MTTATRMEHPFSPHELLFIPTGARSSPLSRKQVEEVAREIQLYHPHVRLIPQWLETTGDKDKKTPLKEVHQSDFFTKEIDELQIRRNFRISIHSAKDLPKPLREELMIVAITQGVDPRDVLVLPEGMSIEDLPYNALIGTSSIRREKALQQLRGDLIAIDIRGTIQERLALLERGKVHALLMAEAALIRLNLTHINRVFLPIEPEPLQGRLAIIARKDDWEMKELFQSLHFG